MEVYGFAVDHTMRRIREFDQQAMGSRVETLDDQLSTCIDPMPIRIVERDVDMSEARHHLECAGAVDWSDAQIVGAVLQNKKAAG